MRISAFLLTAGLVCCQMASAQDASQLHETGVRYLQQSDYGNAIIVLKKAMELAPTDKEIVNDLGLAYFMAGQYKSGYDLLAPFAETKYCDDRTYVIAALCQRGGKNIKEAETVYQIGLQNFPKSGALYCDYGEFLQITRGGTDECIKLWEKGILSDPAYPGNYYNASRYYGQLDNNLWSVIYGEVFVNMESYSNRTVEIKNQLYESYKRLFAYELENISKLKGGFEKAVATTLKKQESLAINGINPETLTAIRTRFVLDWFGKNDKQFPFRLYEHQQQLLEEGIFDAYNQWLFGSVANLNAFQNWTKTHPDEYVSFNQFQRNHMFKMPDGQYYR
jgi:tetratricopeptide (TPR) repeat protein